MSTSPCSVTTEEGYQTCASASNQPEICITHIYLTNPDASDSSPVELSAAAKAFMLQHVMQQQQYQQGQAKRQEGSTGILRRSLRQRRRPRHFSPVEVRIPAARRRQESASYQLVCASLFSFFFLCLPCLLPGPSSSQNLENEFKKYKRFKKEMG